MQQTVESTRRGARGLFDTQQVEIYRGPQSTLSGRAALGGAIYRNSVRPRFEKEGKVQLTYGENNHQQIGVAYNTPLSEDLALRVSGEWSKKDTDISYSSYEHYDLYDDFSTDEYWQGRAQLLWSPAGDDRTEVLVTYAHSYNSPYKDDVVGPNNLGTGYEVYDFDDMQGDLYGRLSNYYYYGGFYMPVFEDVRITETDSFGIQVTHDISDQLSFTSMTGWNRSVTDRKSINFGSNTGAWYDEATNQSEFDDTIVSQEARLNYDSSGLDWVAGLYAAKENNEASSTLDLEAYGYDTGMFKGTYDTINLAVFGEVNYEFVPSWHLIAGGRVDYFKRSIEEQVENSISGFVYSSANTELDYEDTTFIPKIGFEYDVSDTAKLAFVYQQGYRPGGAGIRLSDSTSYEYDTETSHNYELSYKATFMGGDLGLNAAVFYNDWSNQQVEVWADSSDSTSAYITNVGSSESYGAELELTYRATQALDLFASVGLLETEFGDFVEDGNDYTGLPFAGAPRQSLALGYDWGHDTGWFSSGLVSISSDFTSRIESGVTAYNLDGYMTVDAELGYAWDNGSSLSVYAKNLFDETYYLYNNTDTIATLGDRREIGIQFNHTF